MKEYGGYSARTYKDITEGNELEGLDIPEYSRLSWKEKYELCVLQAAKMSGNYIINSLKYLFALFIFYSSRVILLLNIVKALFLCNIMSDNILTGLFIAALRNTESDQILTVWALENGHFAFLKKIIAEDRYSNLEYFEGPTIIDMIMALPDYKSLKVIMTDLPQDLRDEIDLFTILLGATSTGNIRTAKKMFKYGFKSNKEVSRSCTTNAVFGKDYKMMKVLSDNLALYYDEDLVNMCDEFGWTDLNWQRE